MNEGRDDLMIYKMEDLFLFIRNGANIKQGKKDGFPITRIETISDRVVDRMKMGYADIYDAEKYESYVLQNEDILMSHINSVKHLGKSALFTRKFPEEVVIHGMNLLCLRANKDLIFPKYAFYFFNSTLFTKLLMRYVKPSVNQASFAIRDFKKIEINIPSLSIQKKVVDVLERLNKALNLRKEQIEALSALKQSVFLDMFGDPISNPKRLVKKPFEKIGEVITGNTPPRKDKDNYGDYIEWIKSNNISDDTIYLTQALEYLSEKGASIGRVVPANSILVTCIAGSKSSIGRAGIANREVAFNQQINAIIPSEEIVTSFLYTQIKILQPYIQSFSTNSMKGMISKTNFEKIEVIVPALGAQAEFHHKFKQIDSIEEKMKKSLIELEEMYDSLLHKAFNGELFKEEIKA